MRETNSPVFTLSKNRTGRVSTCRWTWERSWADQVLRFDAQEEREQVGGTRLNDYGDHQESQ